MNIHYLSKFRYGVEHDSNYMYLFTSFKGSTGCRVSDEVTVDLSDYPHHILIFAV